MVHNKHRYAKTALTVTVIKMVSNRQCLIASMLAAHNIVYGKKYKEINDFQYLHMLLTRYVVLIGST